MSYRASDRQASVAAYSAVAERAKRFMSTGERREFSSAEKRAAGDEFDRPYEALSNHYGRKSS